MTDTNRRRFLLGAGAVTMTAVGIGTGNSVLAASDQQANLPLQITQHPKQEYVDIKNVGDSTIDLKGYGINFEYQNPNVDQINWFNESLTIAPGKSVIVATGAKKVPSADKKFDHGKSVINDDGNDVIAVIDSNKKAVARSDQSPTTSTQTSTTTSQTETSTTGSQTSTPSSETQTSTPTSETETTTSETESGTTTSETTTEKTSTTTTTTETSPTPNTKTSTSSEDASNSETSATTKNC